ncbi:MAG TPA: hypothetical protein VG961_10480, partial [Ignavibacteria bacterium]|nr:hypothetical protein [Ignavibacteria bacterium]
STHNVCQTEGITHAEDTHTAEGHGDNCSPLCNCMCCNEIVSVSKDASINRTNQITSFSGSYIPEIPPVKIKPGLRPPRS